MKKILRLGILYEREPGVIDLTIEIFQQLDSLEYEGGASDRRNLRGDILNIGDDLRTGVRECKDQYQLEFA